VLCPACGEGAPDGARFCPYCAAPLTGIRAPDPEGESRRPVTAVFTDVVGSTALGERLEPETFRQVMARYFEEMHGVIARHGGTVEKFIGDAVMAVFGIPRVHEDDAMRAVRAADEMRRALAALNDRFAADWGVRIDVRTGVNTGEVVVGSVGQGSFVTGSPVNLAARLEQTAGPGEILLGPDTYRLVRDAVEAVPSEPLDLKGFADPITPMRLLSVAAAPVASRSARSPLVGREDEITLLSHLCQRATDSRHCQLISILGDPGVGKTRLAEELVTRLGDRVTVLRGRCLPYGDGITFYPIAEAVTQAAGLDPRDDPQISRDKLAALLGPTDDQITSVLAEAIGLGGTPAAPEQTLWAIRRFFELLARERPLVLVFDDIQWAEPTFLELLDSIAQRVRGVGIVLLCTARPELLERRPDWGGGAMNAVTTLLEPLSQGDCATLASNLLDGTLDPAVAAKLGEAGGGNPLFTEEYVSMLLEQGTLHRADDRWTLSEDLASVPTPPSLAALLAARIDRLPVDERAVLLHASVIGKVFSTGELEVLLPPSFVDGLPDTLARLCDRDLIRPGNTAEPGGDPWEFLHLLVRDTAYETLPKATRANLHERFAGWLEDSLGARAEDYQEIEGYHLAEAHRYLRELSAHDARLPALAGRAAERLGNAGRRAAARGDAPAAQRLLERTADLAPDAHVRADSRLLMIGPLMDAGGAARAPAVLRAARADVADAADPSLEARLHLIEAHLRFLTAPDTITLDEMRTTCRNEGKALEAMGEEWSLAEALTGEALVEWLAGEAAAMLEVSQRALEVSLRAANLREAGHAAIYLFMALERGATPYPDGVERIRALQDVLAADRVTDSVRRLVLADFHATLGSFDEAVAGAAEAAESFRDLGQERWLATARGNQGHIAELQGRLVEAEGVIAEAQGFFEREGDVANASVLACDHARVLNRLGRHDDAHAVARTVEASAATYDLEPQVWWRTETARALAATGELERARALAGEAVERASRTDFVGVTADALGGRADVDARSGNVASAVEGWTRVKAMRAAKGNVVGEAFADEMLAALAPQRS
jgi:class 3 adenylate cyclase/tetratricopeptide (TPR) repeat protein